MCVHNSLVKGSFYSKQNFDLHYVLSVLLIKFLFILLIMNLEGTLFRPQVKNKSAISIFIKYE